MNGLRRIWLDFDPEGRAAWSSLLGSSGLAVEPNLDYTVGVFRGDELLATGSLDGRIIKEVAVRPDERQGGLLAVVIQALLDRLSEEGKSDHAFVYTKPESAAYFASLGFRDIAATPAVHLMERGRPDLGDYLAGLEAKARPGAPVASVVLKADPLTLGHMHLIDHAAAENALVYLFVLSAHGTTFNAQERLGLVKRMVSDRPDVVVLPTSDYLVSSATFPSYFLKSRVPSAVAAAQASVDACIFKRRIAPRLSIARRYVGTEPFSEVTAIYNRELERTFHGDPELIVLPRLELGGRVVSAGRVRKAIDSGDRSTVKSLCPDPVASYIIRTRMQDVPGSGGGVRHSPRSRHD